MKTFSLFSTENAYIPVDGTAMKALTSLRELNYNASVYAKQTDPSALRLTRKSFLASLIY